MKKTVRIALACLLTLGLLLAPGAAAFADTLSLPASLTVIGEEAFMGDTSLDEVILPDGLTEIQAGAFAGSSLQAIHIPASVTSIAADAFAGTDPVYYVADPNAFDGNLDDMGTVHLTKRAELQKPVSFRNTHLIVDEGVTLVVRNTFEGSELTIHGAVYNYGTIVVEDGVSTVGEGFLSVPYADAYTKIPAESYCDGLSFQLNREARLCLTGLDEFATATDMIWGDNEVEIANGGEHALIRFVPTKSGSYTLCSGVICAELNGSDYIAIPYAEDKDNPNSVMSIGYIVRKNTILSAVGERYVAEIRKYLGIAAKGPA